MTELANEIRSWNKMIAALGGRLRDVFDKIEMPISGFPDFERLEHAGQKQLPPGFDELARLIQRVIQRP